MVNSVFILVAALTVLTFLIALLATFVAEYLTDNSDEALTFIRWYLFVGTLIFMLVLILSLI